MAFKVGSKVKWKWLGRGISGRVEEVYQRSVTRTIKGKKIVRHGSVDNPAYLVKSEAGKLALKLGSELSRNTPEKTKSKVRPAMFAD